MRTAAVWILLAGVALSLVFSALGSFVVFAIYASALIVTATIHWRRGCTRCTNLACAINPHSPHFFLGARPTRAVAADEERFSDINAAAIGAPLVLVIMFGLFGAWLFHPAAVVVSLAFLALGFSMYFRVTCAHCTNDCPANHNPAYARWKSSE